MFAMEFHAAEGGADAETFASELASGVAKFSGMSARNTGRVVIMESSVRL